MRESEDAEQEPADTTNNGFDPRSGAALYAICRRSLIAVGVFSLVANVLMLVPAFFMLNVYDKAVAYNSTSTLWVLSAITLGMYVLLGIMEVVRSRVLVAISSRIDQAVAPELHRLAFENAINTGAEGASAQPLNDLNSLRHFASSSGIFALFDAPWLPIYLFVLFMFHPLLGWMGVIASGLFLVLAVWNQRLSAESLQKANNLASGNNEMLQRELRNAEVVVSMGMSINLRNLWRRRQDEVLDLQESASQYTGLFAAIIKTLRIAIQSAAIAAGAFLVIVQEISPGMIIAGSILIGRALSPVETAVGAWTGFQAATAQYRRLRTLLDNTTSAIAKMQLPPITGRVAAENATIIPPGARIPTLVSVNFECPAGATLLIVGSSGAGKSTLVRAILGLWKTVSGAIRIDGAESRGYDRAELGRQIGYLPQDIELFEGPIRSNIARFHDEDAQSVVAAAKLAGVHEFILSLPAGYDTILGGTDGKLSAGQRQRLALARALYGDPKLVVLDEPNSNLDEGGEKALTEAIQRLKDAKVTVIVVSHRPSLTALADYMVVMNAGRVMEFDTATNVLARMRSDTSVGTSRITQSASGPQNRVQTVTWANK